MDILRYLRWRSACLPAQRWVQSQVDQSPDALWNACRRGDWMLWVMPQNDQIKWAVEHILPIAFRAAAVSTLQADWQSDASAVMCRAAEHFQAGATWSEETREILDLVRVSRYYDAAAEYAYRAALPVFYSWDQDPCNMAECSGRAASKAIWQQQALSGSTADESPVYLEIQAHIAELVRATWPNPPEIPEIPELGSLHG